MMPNNYTITPEQARANVYSEALKQEIVINSRLDESSLKKVRINHPLILAYKARMLGGSSTYKEFADWTHFLLKDYGPRKKCLSLGSGIGRVEKYLAEIGFAERMDTIELCAIQNEDIRLKDAKINVSPGDLNFINLESETYDFILCHGVLHHLINLEHVLHQLNKALKKDGLLLIYEYVGATRWQFSEATLNILRKNFPEVKFKNKPLYRVGGFESIRSGDLLNLIQAQFGDACDQAVFYGGIYAPFIFCTSPCADTYIERVLELDEKLSRGSKISPCYHMGVYRKQKQLIIPAQRWSSAEMSLRVAPPTPLWLKAIRTAQIAAGIRWTKKMASSMKRTSILKNKR